MLVSLLSINGTNATIYPDSFPFKKTYYFNIYSQNFGAKHLIAKNFVIKTEIGFGTIYHYSNYGEQKFELLPLGTIIIDFRYHPWLYSRYQKNKKIKNFDGFFISHYSAFPIKQVVDIPIGIIKANATLSSVTIGYELTFLKCCYLNMQYGYGLRANFKLNEYLFDDTLNLSIGIFIK